MNEFSDSRIRAFRRRRSQWRNRSGFSPDYLRTSRITSELWHRSGLCVNRCPVRLQLDATKLRCHNDAVTASVTRLMLVAHARTDAMRTGRFPGDEPLDDAGLRDLAAVTDFPRANRVLSGPEARSISTAQVFGTEISVEPALADIDYGRWSGLEMTDLPDADAMAWPSDPAFVPPGGESLDALFSRVETWLSDVGSTPGRTLAVTSPAVVRAVVVLVLDAPIRSFWRVDVSPLTRTSVSHRGGVWTVGAVAQKFV